MTLDEELTIFREVALSHLGEPYVWGGDNPLEGFDCSGYAIECLKSVGRLPLAGDWRARDLQARFSTTDIVQLGVLVFWGSPAHHMEVCLNDRVSIGAAGGTSHTTDRAAAIRDDAYIRIRPFRSRGPVNFVDPFAPRPA